MDKEMIEEYNKALRIASQYTTNTIRIRRLLDQSPVTIDSGKQLVSNLTGENLICMRDDTYPIGYIVNPILIYL